MNKLHIKKPFLVITFLIICAGYVYGQDTITTGKREVILNTLQMEGLRGKVKTVTNDRDGYEPKNLEKTIAKYDTIGNMIEKIDEKGVHYKQVFKYDDKGNKVEFDSYNKSNGIDRKETFKYDGKGNVDVDSMFDFKDRFYQAVKYKYKFDNNGRILEADCYSKDSLMNKTTYRYNEKGDTIEKTLFPFTEHVLFFDLNGKYIYSYDKGIKTIHISSNNGGGKVTTEKFNSIGLLTEISITDKTHPKVSEQVFLKYEYDSFGNWTKKELSLAANSDPTITINRTIEYYQ